jgi:hypothetical protein
MAFLHQPGTHAAVGQGSRESIQRVAMGQQRPGQRHHLVHATMRCAVRQRPQQCRHGGGHGPARRLGRIPQQPRKRFDLPGRHRSRQAVAQLTHAALPRSQG